MLGQISPLFLPFTLLSLFVYSFLPFPASLSVSWILRMLLSLQAWETPTLEVSLIWPSLYRLFNFLWAHFACTHANPHMHIQCRNPDPSPLFSPASPPLSLINNSSLADGSPGRVRQWRQLKALNRRSGLNRASGMALIRYFLVPPKQTPPQWNCSHYPSPHNRSWGLWHIHTITPATFTLNCSPGRCPCLNC